MSSRPSFDQYFMRIALDVAARSTCLRRSVGCVLVDSNNQILSTGYNGVARGQPHCNHTLGREYPHACRAARSPSGLDLDRCQAIHAEQNALVQCRDVSAIHKAYVTTCPCSSCFKLLMSTSCREISYSAEYEESLEWQRLWCSQGKILFKIPSPI